MIRIRTTPSIGIDEIQQALADEQLLATAFSDAVEAMARYAMIGKSLFHATLLLDDIREELERKAGRQ